jgi:hypothetical protein
MKLLYTDNFAANLRSFEDYWQINQFPQGFDRLLEALENTTLITLEQFPLFGRSFAQRSNLSVQASIKAQQLLLTHDVREYVMTDYLLLYLLEYDSQKQPHTLHLLSIKHHLQLSFDFQQFIL